MINERMNNKRAAGWCVGNALALTPIFWTGMVRAQDQGGLPDGSSVAHQPAMVDIHDIKPALSVGPDLGWLWWSLGAVIVVATGLLVWLLWRRRDWTLQNAPIIPPPSPDVEALTRLEALAAKTVDDKQFYFQLSAILRDYVERRYEIPAAEMTIEELLPQVARLPLDLESRQTFMDFCRGAELIKFAGKAAETGRRLRDLDFGRDFVLRTTALEKAAHEKARTIHD